MSALPTADVMVEADSSAACSPRLGFPPVPVQDSPTSLPACPSRVASVMAVIRKLQKDGEVRCLHRSNCSEGGLPSPLVSSAPIWILLSAWELSSACASVLAAQNSTPWCQHQEHDVRHTPGR